VHVWGFQINKGDARCAYSRTFSGATTLGGCNYEALGAPGWFHKGGKGQIDATFVGIFQSGPVSINYVYEATETGTNINRRFIWLSASGGTPQVYSYDSAGSLIGIVNPGAIDPRAQENVYKTRWDDGGLLAVGGGADIEVVYNGVSAGTKVGTFTGSDSADMISIGSARGVGVTQNFNGWIQKIESFAEEQI
jgi:hypothetical protein